MTTYPFPLPDALQHRLPSPSQDGNRYVDILVAGKWDGILVIDSAGMCIGVYMCRQIGPWPLPFAVDAIADIRPACLRNRCLAALPFDLFDAALLTILAISPVAVLLGCLVSPLFAIVSILACSAAIRIMYLERGFIFIRPLATMWGLIQIVFGAILLLRFVRSLL